MNFIIEYISNHDYALANYLSVHIGLIDELKKAKHFIVLHKDFASLHAKKSLVWCKRKLLYNILTNV